MWSSAHPTPRSISEKSPQRSVCTRRWAHINKCPVLSQVACGLNHTIAVSMDGNSVWAFGDGDYGKLGLGNSTAKSTPQVVESLQGLGVRKVCCGTQFSVVLTKDGCVFSFGQGMASCFCQYMYTRGK